MANKAMNTDLDVHSVVVFCSFEGEVFAGAEYLQKLLPQKSRKQSTYLL
jgi:hypothetical protein